MKQSTWYIIGGIVALAGGILALFNLFAATIAAVVIAGWAFLVGGAFQIFAAFDRSGSGHRAALGIFGVLSVLLGIWLVFDPLAGMLSLTMAVALILVVSGAVRLFSAFSFSGGNRWALIASSVIAIGLGVIILAEYPETATAFLGIYLGVELMFVGAMLLTLGITGRKLASVLPPVR